MLSWSTARQFEPTSSLLIEKHLFLTIRTVVVALCVRTVHFFLQVGSGYSHKELFELNRKLEPHWRKFDSSNPPASIELAAGFKVSQVVTMVAVCMRLCVAG